MRRDVIVLAGFILVCFGAGAVGSWFTTPALGDWARQGYEGFVEAQKRWSEIASEQSRQLVEALRDTASGRPDERLAYAR